MHDYDIFIDEEKANGYIGFLVTRNTPALQQILFNVRESNQNYRGELKFVGLTINSIRVALSWLNIFFSNNFNVAFYYRKWDGSLSHKRNIIIKTIHQMKKVLHAGKNIVVFMDEDSNHKNLNIQNQIKKSANIIRCYHADSKTFDMLQLCDLLLQCAIKHDKWKWNRHEYIRMYGKLFGGSKLVKSRLKKLLIFHSVRQNKKFKKIRKKVL